MKNRLGGGDKGGKAIDAPSLARLQEKHYRKAQAGATRARCLFWLAISSVSRTLYPTDSSSSVGAIPGKPSSSRISRWIAHIRCRSGSVS